MTESLWLAFTPRDTVFIRDGRSFDAAADTIAETVRPSPTTIAGAAGALFELNPDAVRGPVLAREIDGEWEAFFPVPADLVRTARSRSRVYRAVPTAAAGTTDLDSESEPPARWLMPPEEAEPAKPLTGLVPAGTIAGYLAGSLPSAGATPLAGLKAENDPFKPERRVGLARDHHRRARTGYLYQVTHLRPEDGWAFLAECEFKGSKRAPGTGPVQFGGRGRLADVTETSLTWPACGLDPRQPPGNEGDDGDRHGRRVLVYLATPALWPDGWQIPVPRGARLVAASCGKPLPAATVTPGPLWQQSRVLRWAVPAGSVYLLEFDDPDAGREWATGVHGTAYGPEPPGGDLEYMRTAGFGVVLTGVWT